MALTGKIWRGFYADSITLMQVAEDMRGMPGVSSVALLMATPANRAALEEAEMWPPVDDADVTDLVLAVCAESPESAHAALERAEERLTRRRPRADAEVAERPRSITTAARGWPDANLAVISVPGSHAVNEAHQGPGARVARLPVQRRRGPRR